MKKTFLIVLAAVFLALSALPAGAAGCECGKTPLVLVSGMNTYPLVADKGTENERQVFPPAMDIPSIALKGAAGAAGAAVSLNWNKFGDVLIPVAYELLEPVAFNADGTSKHNVTTSTFPESMAAYPEFASGSGGNEFGMLHTAIDKLGADHVYFFNYDWREDPVKNAADLNTMINRAKAETGHGKVDVAACSLGGAQLMAYLHDYGTDDLESVVFLSPVLSGIYISSECMTGGIEVDKDSLIRYLDHNMKAADGGKGTLPLIVETLDCLGLVDPVLNLTNNGIDALYQRLSDELVKEVFCTMPGIWATLRADAYETAKQSLLDETENAPLIDKIDYFHYNVRLKTKEILEDAMEKGVTVSICSHYDSPAIPIFESSYQHGDGVLDTYCTSGGAYSAPYGETLPEGYVQQNGAGGKNRLSPDNVIDASTCLLPDNVFFFKNIRHVGCPYGSDYNEFVFRLLENKTQPSAGSGPLYPQFMATDDGGKTLYPLSQTVAEQTAGAAGEGNQAENPPEDLTQAEAATAAPDKTADKTAAENTGETANDTVSLTAVPRTGGVSAVAPVFLLALSAALLPCLRRKKV